MPYQDLTKYQSGQKEPQTNVEFSLGDTSGLFNTLGDLVGGWFDYDMAKDDKKFSREVTRRRLDIEEKNSPAPYSALSGGSNTGASTLSLTKVATVASLIVAVIAIYKHFK